MNNLITELIPTLKYNGIKGYGHHLISIKINGTEFKTITNNMMALDAAFDECYDEDDNAAKYYETREAAQIDLVMEILNVNNIEI